MRIKLLLFSFAVLVSRQFVEMSRIRIEGLLAAFPKLIGSGKQHTYVETENVRYVYQPIEALYLLLVTNKQSNILEDLETLRLLSKLVSFFRCFKFECLCSQVHLPPNSWSFRLVGRITDFAACCPKFRICFAAYPLTFLSCWCSIGVLTFDGTIIWWRSFSYYYKHNIWYIVFYRKVPEDLD